MNKHRFFQALEFVCRLGLGALFIYSALAKISDPDDFARSVARYRVLPDFTIGLFSLTMPMLELLAGVLMLFTKRLRESALLVSGMLALFIIALVQALFRGLEISCGCFGVPSVGGREEILIALVRDVVLIAPAVWLMFRQNVLIEPLKWMSKDWRTVCQCIAGVLFAAWLARDTWVSGGFAPSLASETEDVPEAEQPGVPPENEGDVAPQEPKRQTQRLVISTGPVRPGEWNVDFDGVREKAEREKRPMILMRVSKGCGYCIRLEECISGESFRLWQADRAPLMALVQAGSRLSPYRTVKAADDFAFAIKDNLKVPFVCTYWPQNGVTNSVAFNGRRGMMGGRSDKLLAVELMSALDRALGEQFTAGRKSLESILNAATVRISARTEGGGTVKMTPESGLLAEGTVVELVARPDAGSVFLDWRLPDGLQAGLGQNLTVYREMPAGCYTARFKNRSECLPPQLVSPVEETIRVKTREEFRYEIRVDESCRPVNFRIKHPVDGINVDPQSGVVTGYLKQSATNTVEIAVTGFDPGQTEKTVRLTVEPLKRQPMLRRRKR